MVVLLASLRAYFLSKIHGLKIHGGSAGYLCRLSSWVCVPVCVPICVCVYPCACVCVERPCRHSGEKPKAGHKNGLNSGLYGLIGIRLPKRIINPIKRPKFKPNGRVRFLSVS